MRSAVLVCIPLLFFVTPAWPQNDLLDFLLKTLGSLLLITGIFGRLWCTIYIGGRKNIQLVTGGPYALCRNPLYLFNLFFGSGATLVLHNLWFLLVLISAYLVTHAVTILIEESRLAATFGKEYTAYRQRTPRILPRWQQLRATLKGSVTDGTLPCDAHSLRRAVRDGIIYALAFPLGECLEILYRHQLLPLM
jgi:protein-S-isoprenylcysteine O-methyltransferase Ste14